MSEPFSRRVEPGDPRFEYLIRRGVNKRFSARPDYVRLVTSTRDAVEAVQEAVREGRRIGVRGGGHCLDGLVTDPAVRALIDTSLMTGVTFDPEREAIAVEAGTLLGEVYRRMCLGWGVMVPAGESPQIAMGGHVAGGAFGFFCREHGLAADHLHAVEVVVVDDGGRARSVVATRDAADPNHDLWWAHTGGGGGNFGIVTRAWFRSPGATGGEALLPRAPASLRTFRLSWSWDDLDEAAFVRLASNFGAWAERNAAPSPLFSLLFLRHRDFGKLEVKGLTTAPGGEGARLVDEHLAALVDGVSAPHNRAVDEIGWLPFVLDPFPELFAGSSDARFKGKDAFLRRPFTDDQLALMHRHLGQAGRGLPGAMVGMATYGGQVNRVAPGATASAQRGAILSTSYSAGWMDPRDEERHLDFVRALYREVFADAGGVPAPGDRYDGAMINHPDLDLADPRLNTSGVPWPTLYYKENYPRLQRIKARWDPGNVFQHKLGISPAG